jgi:hypothetical protein
MIFFAMTKPKKKLQMLLKIALVVVLLTLLLPLFYNSLVRAGAMERFVGGEISQTANENYEPDYPGEPMRVNGNINFPNTEYVAEMAGILAAE